MGLVKNILDARGKKCKLTSIQFCASIIENAKKRLIRTPIPLTTRVYIGEHEATRNAKKARNIKAFLNIREHA